MSRQQNTGQNHCRPVANKSFENVAGKVKILGVMVTNEEIKSRLNSGNACYHAVENPLSSRLQSKNEENKILKTVTLAVILYGCEPGRSH
jgi:hypothetical protein